METRFYYLQACYGNKVESVENIPTHYILKTENKYLPKRIKTIKLNFLMNRSNSH